ncbi:helix-turn-helix domain-containing protein [Parabacteroides merdae]|uniref:helix-turn-helix domain-containing protein n=1 Tax=Parabacteroides merdae TaxID=46503 RepID=UPI0034A2709E
MDTIKFEKGKSYELPVKETVKAKRSYCLVEANKKLYTIQLYPFQEKEDIPDKLVCFVKDINEETGEPVLRQDTTVIIPHLYQTGNTYTFKVKEINNHSISVVDDNGFQFNIDTTGKFTYGYKVDCFVKDYTKGRLLLEIVNSKANKEQMLFLSEEQIIDILHIDKRWASIVNNRLKSAAFYGECQDFYIHENGEWIIRLMEHIGKELDTWAIRRCKENKKAIYNKTALLYFERACIYLLEDSDLLLCFTDDDREVIQNSLSDFLQSTRLMLQAIDLISDKKQEITVNHILEKIDRSGYLIEPGKQLKLLLFLLSLDPSLIDEKMNRVFDIIINGKHSSWEHEPFRQAFVDMLERYILQNVSKINSLVKINTDTERRNHEKMIIALSIQQLLLTDDDAIDRQLNSSLLYRYLTLLNVGDKTLLLDKALLSLASVDNYKPHLQWNDFRNIDFIAAKALSKSGYGNKILQQSYTTSACTLEFDGRNIEIHASRKRSKEIQVTSRLMPSDRLKIYLPSRIQSIRENEKSLRNYQMCWKDIETQLLSDDNIQPSAKKTRLSPGEDDEVNIIIKDKLNEEGTLFSCEITDTSYIGSGTISTKDIINYELRTNEAVFKDENGDFLIYKATVKQVLPGGTYTFSMLGQVREFVQRHYKPEDKMLCKVNAKDYKRSDTLLCINNLGMSVKVKMGTSYKSASDFEKGSFLYAEFENFDTKSGSIWAYFLEPSSEEFTSYEAFENCMYNITDTVYVPESDEEPEESLQPQVNMDASYVDEIIRIIDRLSAVQADYIDSYNYLSFARILALVTGDTQKAQVFQSRLMLLQRLQHYAENKTKGETMLKELQELEKLPTSNAQLQTSIIELKLMAYLNNPDKNDEVQRIMKLETADNHLQELCQLVYCYNALSGFGLYKERENIRRKFYEKLGFSEDYKQRYCYGEENLHQEFKSSTVFPPDNGMRVDLEVQTINILKVICGFMNTEDGGTLYIGVSNDGLALGLENDLAYFGSTDKFNLHIHNSISDHLGKEADNLVKEEWLDDEDRKVYKLSIQASKKEVLLDGALYRRQSSSTRLIELKN